MLVDLAKPDSRAALFHLPLSRLAQRILRVNPDYSPAFVRATLIRCEAFSQEGSIMRKLPIMSTCCALFWGVVAFLTPADARRAGGAHVGGHAMGHVSRGRAFRGNGNRNWAGGGNINRNVTRNVNRNVNRRYVYRNGRRGYWRNGVWILAPAVAGATYVASCAYEYGRWQSTSSTYWRDRYYECAN